MSSIGRIFWLIYRSGKGRLILRLVALSMIGIKNQSPSGVRCANGASCREIRTNSVYSQRPLM